MNSLVYHLYLLILGVIHCIKWIEFQFLKLLAPLLRKKGKKLCETVGVVLICSDDDQKSVNNETVLSKCSKKYDSLVHIRVNDNTFFTRIANLGSLAFGETYMDKVWDWTKSPDDITQFIKRTGENNMMELYWNCYNRFLESLELQTFNLQTKNRATQAAEVHYDLGNDLYELMLDPWLQYTCGYWAKADNLNQAQLDKLELIAKKLDLKPGMKVLDIGCGWGTLCKYLAENYGVECVGITISKEGVEYGQKINSGLPVEIRLQDYRDVNEQFDRVVSIGCLEHVGIKNHRKFMEIAHRCLKDDGIFLLHSIGVNHKNVPSADKWLHKYIFPNANLPRPQHITKQTYGLFIIEDWHDFSADYAKTLNAWRDNFINNWGKIEKIYGERFYRMWIYYLSFCQGLFLARRVQLWQVVLSKDGLKTGYRAPR